MNDNENPIRKYVKRITAVVGAILLFIIVKGSGFVVGAATSEGIEQAASYAMKDEGSSNAAHRPDQIEAALTRMHDDPRFGPMLNGMQKHFPADYTGFVSIMKTSKSADEARIRGFTFMRDFRLRQTEYIVQASPVKMLELAELEIELLDRLAWENPKLCAGYIMTGFRPHDSLSPESQLVMARFTTHLIEVAADGYRQEVKNSGFELTDEQYDLWFEAMAAEGTSWDELEALSDGRLALYPIATQCRVGTNIYKSLLRLPLKDAAAVYGSLVIAASQGK